MNESNETQREISLIELWHIILRNFGIIVILTTIVFIFATTYAWFIATPDYVSNADVMVQVEESSSGQIDSGFDLISASRLLDTVKELTTKDVVIEAAILELEKMGYEGIEVKYIRDGLNISSSSTSYFINVSFVDNDTEFAQDVVDAVIQGLIDVTDEENAFPVLTNKIRRTSFASDAEYNSPNRVLFSIVGLILGGVISLGFVFLRETLTTNFKSKEEIEHALDIQILGVIPLMSSKGAKNVKK